MRILDVKFEKLKLENSIKNFSPKYPIPLKLNNNRRVLKQKKYVIKKSMEVY